MKYKIKSFLYSIGNLIYFFKVVWKFRGYSYDYNMDIFNHSLKRTAKKIRKNQRIVDADEYADSILKFIDMYDNYDNTLMHYPEYGKYLKDSVILMKKINEGENRGMYEIEIKAEGYSEEQTSEMVDKWLKIRKKNWEEAFNYLRDNIMTWWD